jgi:L-ascorbate metabolism protein UlaG (beta-lactamase superfamily)
MPQPPPCREASLDAEVLIAGAGPVGLLLGVLLGRSGITVALLEKRTRRGEGSRAIGVTPTSLQIIKEIGLLEHFLGEGLKIRRAGIHSGERLLARIRLDGAPMEFPFILSPRRPPLRFFEYIRAMKTGTLLLFLLAASSLGAEAPKQADVFPLKDGELKIIFIGHGTLLLDWNGWIIHVDPFGQQADYRSLPKADLILISHEHSDHLDVKAVGQITKNGTVVVANVASAGRLKGAQALANGKRTKVHGLAIEAVPAYNTTSGHTQFHPKGRDNGYVLDFPGLRLYIAGDTENIPEMSALSNIAVAFLPMNQPYTMTPEQAAAAARSFRPRVLYPYHYGETDPQKLVAALKDSPGIEVRVRDLR